MAKKVVCEWCSETFRSEAGLEWHMQGQLKIAGLLISLDPDWRGVPHYTVEKPGDFYIAVASIYTQHAREDEEEFWGAFAKDGERVAKMVRALDESPLNH